MANEVAFTIKIKESGEIRKITANADELAGALNNVKKSAENLRTKAINFAQWSQSIEAAQRSVSELQGALAGLSAAYAAEEAAVSKLQTVMRNTMDATDDEVKSILELASAQQKLGVIGDEVQIAGAQELATYLNKTETLR